MRSLSSTEFGSLKPSGCRDWPSPSSCTVFLVFCFHTQGFLASIDSMLTCLCWGCPIFRHLVGRAREYGNITRWSMDSNQEYPKIKRLKFRIIRHCLTCLKYQPRFSRASLEPIVARALWCRQISLTYSGFHLAWRVGLTTHPQSSNTDSSSPPELVHEWLKALL